MLHEEYMRLALNLAKRGTGRVSPNPLVGAVIVRDGRVIGEGWHAYYGGLHAERAALKDCLERGEDPADADIYVTLEPCCHHGKQPPCTEALIEHRIKHVYVGSGDPNPKVAGKGLQILREHGIQVTEHILEDECKELNSVFFHYITTGLPMVTLKYAMTLDGKIACFTGASQWVTGETARRHVHETRNRLSAIMVGIGTVLADDPLLTCRLEGGRNPIRIVCDSRLRTPLTSNLVSTACETPLIIATCCRDQARQAPYIEAGCTILECSAAEKNEKDIPDQETRGDGEDSPLQVPSCQVDLRDLMKKLGGMGIDSILLEGGSTLAWSALSSGIVRRVQAYIAPKIFGGNTSKTPVGGTGFSSPSEAALIDHMTITQLGGDYLMEGDLVRTC